MKKHKIGLFWFTNDLRIHDNPALMKANILMDELICVYVKDTAWRTSSLYSQGAISNNANDFLISSLADLDNSLALLDQKLNFIEADLASTLGNLINNYRITDVFRSENSGWYENHCWALLKTKFPEINYHSVATHTLFERDALPFSISDLPNSFTQFKHAVKTVAVATPISKLSYLPPQKAIVNSNILPKLSNNQATYFQGGEKYALTHLQNYFSTSKPSSYKEVRNAIDGWDNSCKFSPWLANGSMSVRKIMTALSAYEKDNSANDSTYWIYFELLWREYFQWYAHKNGHKLFIFKGISDKSPLTSYYPERFKKWVCGETPYPLVNACMNELKATGYLSNRGRQIVASCLVNELSMDWRYGAAYFEQALIDYDVASNWGNWQYLAGVGADTRPKRHFNLEKQTQQFDPDGEYIKKWAGERHAYALDSVDAADWPIRSA